MFPVLVLTQVLMFISWVIVPHSQTMLSITMVACLVEEVLLHTYRTPLLLVVDLRSNVEGKDLVQFASYKLRVVVFAILALITLDTAVDESLLANIAEFPVLVNDTDFEIRSTLHLLRNENALLVSELH